MIMIIQKAYTHDLPDSFTVKQISRPVVVFRDIDVYLNRMIIAEGEGVRLKEYLLRLKHACPDDSIKISEKSFLQPELTQNPAAVTIESLTLKKGRTKRLFIVEKLTPEINQGKPAGE